MSFAKGPNDLNLADYTQGRGEDIPYDPQEIQRYLQEESHTMEQQFDRYVHEIQKYDEVLAEVAKNIDEVSAEEYFITEFYPEFPLNTTYEDDQQKVIIYDTDVELAKVVDNLQRNNRVLKQQIKGWLFEYSKKTRLSEVLLSENKLLRKYVSAKNKDIVKLITTIANSENSELSELNDQLNELKQENGVLLDHLQSLRHAIREKQDEQRKVIDAVKKAQLQKLDIQSEIQAGEDEEEHYSKMVSLLESSIDQSNRREKKLIQEKERLTKIKKQYENDHQLIEKEINACKIDRDEIDRHLKAKFQGHLTQKQTFLEEIEDLNEKIQKVKQQTKTYQAQIARYEFKIDEYTNVCNEITKKSAQTQQILKKTEQQLKNVKQIEIKYLSSIDIINFDIQVLKSELKQLQQQQQQIKQKHKKQLKQLQNQKKQQISKWNNEHSQTQSKVSKTLLKQKTNLTLAKKQIEDWQYKISEKKTQILDLKQQLIEIKENQKQLSNLKQQLQEVQKK